MRKVFFLTFFIFVIISISIGFFYRNEARNLISMMSRDIVAPNAVSAREVQKILIPAFAGMTQGGNTIKKVTTAQPKKPPLKIPERFNLDIPFTPQAPHANWNMPYQEACEEASVLMAQWFIQGEKTKIQSNAEILEMIEWEKNVLGYYEDTTIEETLRIVREYVEFPQSFIVKNPTPLQIKEFVSQGFPVLVPASGKLLKNPNFKNGGPKFHMLVIRGYTKNAFVTNDPGTRNGKNYQYPIPIIMNAIHDWNGGDVLNGEKAVIVVKYKL